MNSVVIIPKPQPAKSKRILSGDVYLIVKPEKSTAYDNVAINSIVVIPKPLAAKSKRDLSLVCVSD